MNTYILRHATTKEEIIFEAVGHGYSKGERMYEFYCDVKGKIDTRSFNTYVWIMECRYDTEIKEL